MKFIRKFFRNESGASAIEYGLIAALIALAVVAAIDSASNKPASRVPQATEQESHLR